MTLLYAFTPEQDEVRRTLRRLLGTKPWARAAYDGGEDSPNRDLWRALVDVGIAGLGVPEAVGGSGRDVTDLVVAAEEAGRAVAPIPFVANALLGQALGESDPDGVLAAALGGELIAGVAFEGPGLVYDAAGADVLLVDCDGVAGIVRPAECRALPSVDHTRPVADASWDPASVRVVPSAPPVHRLRQLQLTLYAAEAVGVAAEALDRTAVYARDRRQFGVPIGTFQAVKHRLADMLVDVECARSAAYAAAWGLRDGGDATLATHMAQAVATEAATRVVSGAIQLHGGIGVTWEHDLHLFLRRAKGLELALGSPGWHYEQIAAALLGGHAAERG